MPAAKHSTANGPQLEWHIKFSKSLVALKHTLMTPDKQWTSETDYFALIQQQKKKKKKRFNGKECNTSHLCQEWREQLYQGQWQSTPHLVKA